MRTLSQTGKTSEWTNTTGSAVVSGQVVAFGAYQAAVATVDIAAGAVGVVALTGVYMLTKTAGGGTGFAQGAAVWVDPATSIAYNAVASGRIFAGYAHLAASDAQSTVDTQLAPFGLSGDLEAGLATGFPLPLDAWRRASEPNAALPTEVVNWPIALEQARIFDAPSTPVGAVGGAPSADDLGLNDGGWQTGNPPLSTQDLKSAGATTEYALIQREVPSDYEPGTPISLRVNAGMNTTAADTAAEVDVEVVRAAAPTVDINTTAAQSINSLVAADKDFILTPTNLVPGDVLNIRVAVTVNDGAGATAVLGQVYSAELVPSNAHLLVVDPGHGVGNPTLETGDLDSLGAVTRTARFAFEVPDNYVAGGAATVRLNANMKTNVADTSATIDVVAVRAAAPTVDINTTAAQSVNFLAADDYDFALNATDLVPGDQLDVVVTLAVNDAATGAPVIGVLNALDCQALLDVKG